MTIDDKNAIRKVGKKKKITLNFKNGSSIEFKEDNKFKVPIDWNGVDSILFEQWLTKEEVAKLYPKLIK